MIDGQRITIEIQGVSVEGKIVSLLPNDITVEITVPYQGERAGMHVPHIMMGHVPDRLADAEGTITPRGIQRAEELLTEVILSCKKQDGHDAGPLGLDR